MNSHFHHVLALAIVLFATGISSAKEKNRHAGSELMFKTERVIVFKDGYCMVVKKGTGKTDANGMIFSDDVPNSAILGSFWAVPTQGTVKSMVAGWVESTSEFKRPINCTNQIEIIKANIGRTCTLTLPDKDETVLKGKIIKLLSNDDLASPAEFAVDQNLATLTSSTSSQSLRPNSSGMGMGRQFGASSRSLASSNSTRTSPQISVTATTGSHFLLQTAQGDIMLAVNGIRNLTIAGMTSTFEQQIKETKRHKRLTWNFGKPNSEVELNLMYFRPDVRWIPTYRVNLSEEEYPRPKSDASEETNPAKASTAQADAKLAPGLPHKTAEIFMQGELLNEAEDFIDVPIHVVVGVPNFRFRSVPSPMILEADLRNVLAQAAPSIMGNQSQMSNALYTQRGGEVRSNRAAGLANRAMVDLPTELSSSAGNDLFVYQLEKMTLRKGERATVPILRTKVPYRDIYTWDVEITHAESFAATSSDNPSPLVLAKNEVWRQVELINDTDLPWTTGAAMFVDGFQPLAQELLTYTSPGGICRVPVTISVDMRGKVEDQELSRKLNALTWRRNDYARVAGQIDIELANNKTYAVPVEVKIRFGGKANTVSDNGTKSLDAYRPEDWQNRQGDTINNSSTVKWKSSILPGECFNPTVNYEFLLRY